MSKKNKVLIVDDDKHNLNICQITLSDAYDIEIAHDGAEALNMLDTFKPDVVLTDWEMPVLNGLELLKKIKSNPATKNIQVVMMSGIMTKRENLLDALQYGIIDLIRKPFDTIELKARINSVMQSVNHFRSEIDSKNQELVWLTLLLSENSVLIDSAITQINSILNSLPKNDALVKSKIQEIKSNLSSRIMESTWKQFEKYFKEVHPNFNKNISAKHPTISPAELKLASLLSLNLDTKEIAAILHQSTDSVKVSRTRLRKKLEIESEINLIAYLMQF